MSHLRRFKLPLFSFLLLGPLALAHHPGPAPEHPTAALASAQDEKPAKVVRFTGIPTANTADLEAKYRPLSKYLGEKLGVTFEYVPSADYNASVDAFANGDLLLAWFGGFTGVQARKKVEGAQVIACGKVDRAYKSYFIAHKSLGLAKADTFPTTLAGKKFTFGSASSTSGRLMPEYFIRKETKKTPKEFFGAENNYSGAHDKTLKLVEAGTFEAGVVDYKQYEKMVAEFQKDPKSDKGIDPDKVRIVWVTPAYVDYNFTAHPKLDEQFGAGFTQRLKAALVGIKDEALLKALDRPEGLVEATNADFEVLVNVAKECGLAR